ncbi:MAG: hypothetical protein Q8O14_08215 [bacterium]|nr:hypothetical protein [bacterium]
MRAAWIPALALILLLGASSCDEQPESDPGAADLVTLVALLEPGSEGLQEVLLSQPLPLGVLINDSTAHLPGATLLLRRVPGGEEIQLEEQAARWRYAFSRADFPLQPGDSLLLEMSGTWAGRTFHGSAATRIVSAEGLAFSFKPNDRSHGFDADTLMVYDPSAEDNLANPSAFYVDWCQDCGDGCDYRYQLEFNAVVLDSAAGRWISTPKPRLHWLRDDKELAWQVGPYPDLRLPPGRRVAPQPVSWGFFVFVDSADTYRQASQRDRRMGYYDITLRRLNDPASRFFFSTHWWIRERGYDPVDFNLVGEHCQGVVGSCARTNFRVAIVDDTPR